MFCRLMFWRLMGSTMVSQRINLLGWFVLLSLTFMSATNYSGLIYLRSCFSHLRPFHFPAGFSGCHRYEAHQRLGLPTIRCKVRRGTKETLRFTMILCGLLILFLFFLIFILQYFPAGVLKCLLCFSCRHHLR